MLFRSLLLLGCLLAGYFLYVAGLDTAGLLSVDEPRYAAIGREMARSGDWITPRLWGEVWLEKPPLLFWLIGLGTLAGLPGEWAARLPGALLALAFLPLYYRRLASWFGPSAAAWSTAILATSAGWLAFSHAATTDIPLAVTFASALLLAGPWAVHGEKRNLAAVGALFGLAVLAKALVPLALGLPLAVWGRRRWRDLVLPTALAAAIALPWYLACLHRHGRLFIDELFLRHHLSRFSSGEDLHQQPFWFYLPVLLLGLFPWSLLVPAALSARLFTDRRLRYFTVWLLWGLFFFSLSAGKLPGYLLPLLPAAAALLGVLASTTRAGAWLAATVPLAMAVVAVPAAAILPVALDRGLSRALPGEVPTFYLPLVIAGFAATAVLSAAARRGHHLGVFTAAAAAAVLGYALSRPALLRALDDRVSARTTAHRLSSYVAPNETICADSLRRTWEYGLNYYLPRPLTTCPEGEGRYILEPGEPPFRLTLRIRLDADPPRDREVPLP